MIKPYLLSIYSETPGFNCFLKSMGTLKNSISTWLRIELEKYPGHIEKFRHIPFNELSEDAMIIYTDTDDVIFQKEIPELKNKIYVTPEFMNWDETSFYYPILKKNNFHKLDGLPIFNSGCWAMPVYKLKEFVDFMLSENEDVLTLRKGNGFNEPIFNLWLMNQEYEIHPTLSICLYNALGKKQVIKTDEGFKSPTMELYSIVHANGNNKDLLVNKK